MISVKVGKLELGEGQELLFVAELGTCYDGDVETAKLLLRKASEAGAQLAKLECFIPEDVYRLKKMARATKQTKGFLHCQRACIVCHCYFWST